MFLESGVELKNGAGAYPKIITENAKTEKKLEGLLGSKFEMVGISFLS